MTGGRYFTRKVNLYGMERRALLASAGTTLASALAGCSTAGSPDVDGISIGDSTVEQGETATISIEAPNLSGLHISDFPEELRSEEGLQLGEATFEPSPETVWTTSPPHWQFSERDTEGAVPIRTSPETPPGTYEFVLDFYVGDDEEPRRRDATVTVLGETG